MVAHVSGTAAAEEAKIDAQIPQTAKVDRKTAAVEVEYDGNPQFKPIEGTSLELAENSNITVMKETNGKFYALDNGVWFSSDLADGPWSVADPRIDKMPAQDEKLVTIIRALDGTWHRPFTTMELAALQSLMDPEETLELDGLSDSAWRERIGNAVPPEAAAAIAGVMGTTLLLAWSGETFMLSSVPIWVKPVAVALSVQQQGGET